MSDAINITVTPPATQTTNVVVTPPPQTVVNISTNNSALAISPTVYPVASPGARFALSPSVVKNGDIITCFGNPEIFTLTFVSAITDTTTFEVKFYDDNDDDPAIWDAPACATTSIAATAFATSGCVNSRWVTRIFLPERVNTRLYNSGSSILMIL